MFRGVGGCHARTFLQFAFHTKQNKTEVIDWTREQTFHIAKKKTSLLNKDKTRPHWHPSISYYHHDKSVNSFEQECKTSLIVAAKPLSVWFLWKSFSPSCFLLPPTAASPRPRCHCAVVTALWCVPKTDGAQQDGRRCSGNRSESREDRARDRLLVTLPCPPSTHAHTSISAPRCFRLWRERRELARRAERTWTRQKKERVRLVFATEESAS